MSEKRLLDNSIKSILKQGNFCRKRAYEELDIKPLYVSSAVARARGFSKWKNSTGMIAECIESADVAKTRKQTWIKTMKIDPELPERDLRKAIIEDRSLKASDRDKSLVGEWARRYDIKSGAYICKAEYKQAGVAGNISNLLKIRLGTFYYTNNLVRMGYISSSFKNKCVSCGEDLKEDAEHLMLYCKEYSNARAQI